jgi:hypothetical protein
MTVILHADGKNGPPTRPRDMNATVAMMRSR